MGLLTHRPQNSMPEPPRGQSAEEVTETGSQEPLEMYFRPSELLPPKFGERLLDRVPDSPNNQSQDEQVKDELEPSRPWSTQSTLLHVHLPHQETTPTRLSARQSALDASILLR
jgi:hypothetical protein